MRSLPGRHREMDVEDIVWHFDWIRSSFAFEKFGA
jgi:hypothetical protein